MPPCNSWQNWGQVEAVGLETELLCHPLPDRISLQPLWSWSSTHRHGLWFDSHGSLAKPVWIGGHKA